MVTYLLDLFPLSAAQPDMGGSLPGRPGRSWPTSDMSYPGVSHRSMSIADLFDDIRGSRASCCACNIFSD